MLNQIQEALAQIQELQKRVVEDQMFRGWSGRGRIVCGFLAGITPVVLSRPGVPQTAGAHLLAWAVLCGAAALVSGISLIYWFLKDPVVARDWRKLRPMLQIFPPLAVGAVMTVAAIVEEHYDWLFAIWMLNYGLSNLAARRVLPRSIALVGIFYLLAGTACLWIGIDFLNPWPMGLTFAIGEIAAGAILHLDVRRKIPQ